MTGAAAQGRTLFVQWQPDVRCAGALTGFTIAGRATPDGPIIGTISVPVPNAREWVGTVPPGSYYVSVMQTYYGMHSPTSNWALVHVQ